MDDVSPISQEVRDGATRSCISRSPGRIPSVSGSSSANSSDWNFDVPSPVAKEVSAPDRYVASWTWSPAKTGPASVAVLEEARTSRAACSLLCGGPKCRGRSAARRGARGHTHHGSSDVTEWTRRRPLQRSLKAVWSASPVLRSVPGLSRSPSPYQEDSTRNSANWSVPLTRRSCPVAESPTELSPRKRPPKA